MIKRTPYDVMIAGGGLSGLSAALFAAKAGKRTLLVTKGSGVLAIGGGTTAYVFAQHLLESQQSSGITILTNSIPVAERPFPRPSTASTACPRAIPTPSSARRPSKKRCPASSSSATRAAVPTSATTNKTPAW